MHPQAVNSHLLDFSTYRQFIKKLRKFLKTGCHDDDVSINERRRLMYNRKKYFLDGNDVLRYKIGEKSTPIVITNREHAEKVLNKYHINAKSTHLGMNATISMLRDKYWWPGISEFVKVYIKSCEKCVELKKYKRNMQPLYSPSVQKPLDPVEMALIEAGVDTSLECNGSSTPNYSEPTLNATSTSTDCSTDSHIEEIFEACKQIECLNDEHDEEEEIEMEYPIDIKEEIFEACKQIECLNDEQDEKEEMEMECPIDIKEESLFYDEEDVEPEPKRARDEREEIFNEILNFDSPTRIKEEEDDVDPSLFCVDGIL